MGKKVKIVNSPFNPNLETAEGLVIKLHVPYSDTSVTVQVNPSIDDYKEAADQPGVKVRQVTMSSPTDQTRTLSFDLESNRQQTITIENQGYQIELLEIGKENIQGQDFQFFAFEVNRI